MNVPITYKKKIRNSSIKLKKLYGRTVLLQIYFMKWSERGLFYEILIIMVNDSEVKRTIKVTHKFRGAKGEGFN